jgi:hypothetical protein
MGGEFHFVVGFDVVFASVALQPTAHPVAVQRDALNRFSRCAQAFEVGQNINDQAQRVRALRHFSKLVNGS